MNHYEGWYSGLPGRPESSGSTNGSTVQKNRDGVPTWSGEATSFEEFVESCLLYEQTVVREKRYLCGPRIASELKGPARRILIGRPADWLSHEGGVRKLVAALRDERGQPKVPEMSELLLRYFKGTKRMRRPIELDTMDDQWNFPEHEGEEEHYEHEDQATSQGWSWNSWQSWDYYGWQSRDYWQPKDWQQQPRTKENSDTSEWGRQDLPEILPDFIQGWYLFMDSGLEVMERNVLQAELRGDFSVRAVEEVLRKHWTDVDLRKRDAEKGRYLANWASETVEESDEAMDPLQLEAEGFSAEDIQVMSVEEDRAQTALAAMQDARRTLRDARARQHAVKMSRQYYSVNPSGYQSSGSNQGLWKQMSRPTSGIKCFRCGGPHKIADCKEKPRDGEKAHVVAETAPFVTFLSEAMVNEQIDGRFESKEQLSWLSTNQVVAQGKAVIDGGATRTVGSIEALEKVVALNQARHGEPGVEKIDFSDRPVFGFGNSSRNQCASTASLRVPLAGQHGTMKVHALDQGEAPILLSIHSLRQLGTIIDFEADMAVFRNVDPCRLIPLERSSAGHQVMPLTEDIYAKAKQLKEPMASFRDVEY
eukprot:symbB.v1.2.002643.t1/scaffold142.1/size299426/1